MIIKDFSYKESLELAKEDIRVFEEIILPMLKSQKSFSFADLDVVSTAFLNAGSRMNIFNKIKRMEIRDVDKKMKAEEILEKYTTLVKETFSIIEEKEESEKE